MPVLRDVRFNQDLAVGRGASVAPRTRGGGGGGGQLTPQPVPPGALGRSSPTLRGIDSQGGDGRFERSQRGGDFVVGGRGQGTPQQALAVNRALASPLGMLATGIGLAVNPVLGLGMLGIRGVTGLAEGGDGRKGPAADLSGFQGSPEMGGSRARDNTSERGGDSRDNSSGGHTGGTSTGGTGEFGGGGGRGAGGIGSFEHGGPVTKTGQGKLHAGEFVLSPEAVRAAGGPVRLGDIMDRLEAVQGRKR